MWSESGLGLTLTLKPEEQRAGEGQNVLCPG